MTYLDQGGFPFTGSQNKLGIQKTGKLNQFRCCNAGPAVFTEETLKASFLRLDHSGYGDWQRGPTTTPSLDRCAQYWIIGLFGNWYVTLQWQPGNDLTWSLDDKVTGEPLGSCITRNPCPLYLVKL